MENKAPEFPDEVYAIWSGGRMSTLALTVVLDETIPHQRYVRAITARQVEPEYYDVNNNEFYSWKERAEELQAENEKYEELFKAQARQVDVEGLKREILDEVLKVDWVEYGLGPKGLIIWMIDHLQAKGYLSQPNTDKFTSVENGKLKHMEKICAKYYEQSDLFDEMKDGLELAAKTFRWYEELHRAKPDHLKADANKMLAEKMEQALASRPGVEVGE